MRVVRNIPQLKRIITRQKMKGLTVGLVPTMGYLHEGHLSLVRIARRKADYVVVSVFVNPSQFGPEEDYTRYPRDTQRDLHLLRTENADLIFLPSVKSMYPAGYRTSVRVQFLSTLLCGRSRPHHFEGVTTVVLKLFTIVNPDLAVFGKKDYQQALIITQMVRDLNLDVKIILGKIIREKNGLAMSSRNAYLTNKQRKDAAVLYQSLQWVKRQYQQGYRDTKKTRSQVLKMIRSKGGRIDYVVFVDRKTLMPVLKLRHSTLIALAVFFGKTRLIDNTIL